MKCQNHNSRGARIGGSVSSQAWKYQAIRISGLKRRLNFANPRPGLD
jgi:hypothetical protein